MLRPLFISHFQKPIKSYFQVSSGLKSKVLSGWRRYFYCHIPGQNLIFAPPVRFVYPVQSLMTFSSVCPGGRVFFIASFFVFVNSIQQRFCVNRI